MLRGPKEQKNGIENTSENLSEILLKDYYTTSKSMFEHNLILRLKKSKDLPLHCLEIRLLHWVSFLLPYMNIWV